MFVTTLINPINPNSLFHNLKDSKENYFNESKRKSFVGVIQTSDFLGSPDFKLGNADILSGGGRIQPGCYKSTDSIEGCKYDEVEPEN